MATFNKHNVCIDWHVPIKIEKLPSYVFVKTGFHKGKWGASMDIQLNTYRHYSPLVLNDFKHESEIKAIQEAWKQVSEKVLKEIPFLAHQFEAELYKMIVESNSLFK